ncbi:uncharacterized protein LOC105160969 [Sesamum indicum]|uniref:Uncharacterized protein LOC105160969 n=1 Tax=Sesamum indicum TaxID=4182 RepID=A0A8M8UR07_SESIN|nr:uncharacterized protein LOC105160969 [Sesamum indicum]
MVESFEGVLKKEWCREDLKVLTSQIKEHESLLRLKRRWLMDLPLSISEQKRVEETLPPEDKMLPESLLREDDVSYEDIRTCIEIGFGAHDYSKEPHCLEEDLRVFDSRYGLQDIYLLLDVMTNKGLYSFVEILTGGLIKFEKTNWSMKRTIKKLLPEVIATKNDNSKKKLKQLFLLLLDAKNFRGNQLVRSIASEAYRAAAVKVLDGLEDFPFRTLIAMHRKLKGVKGYIPSMQSQKSRRGRDSLIRVIKKMCMKMLSDLGNVKEPAEPLAGALGVAGLTLKLIMNCPGVRDFRKFSPETEALHNDIAKAIHLLDDSKRVSLIELKKVQFLLDPNSELSVRSLRMAVRNLLTEYLFECSDMEKVPDCLVETLDIINRRSQFSSRKKHSSSKIYSSPQELMKEVIQKEVEHVLAISAQAKEVLLDLHPEHEFDEDFDHAYVEDFDGNDDLYISDDDEHVGDISQHHEIHSYSSDCQTESIGETNPAESNSPVSTSERDDHSPLLSPVGRLNIPLDSMHITDAGLDETSGFVRSLSCKKSEVPDEQPIVEKQYPSGFTGELGQPYSDSLKVTTKQNLSSLCDSPARNSSYSDLKSEDSTSCSRDTPKYVGSDFLVEDTTIVSKQRKSGNQYLEVQEACDLTSMVAYHFVGHMLDKLAKSEGIELCQADRLYLRSYSSVPEDLEESLRKFLPSEFPGVWKDLLRR